MKIEIFPLLQWFLTTFSVYCNFEIKSNCKLNYISVISVKRIKGITFKVRKKYTIEQSPLNIFKSPYCNEYLYKFLILKIN